MVCCKKGGGGCTCKLTGKDGIVTTDKGGGSWELSVNCNDFPCSTGGGIKSVTGTDGVKAVTTDGNVTVSLDPSAIECTDIQPVLSPCLDPATMQWDAGGKLTAKVSGGGVTKVSAEAPLKVAPDSGTGDVTVSVDPSQITCDDARTVLTPCLDTNALDWPASGKLTVKFPNLDCKAVRTCWDGTIGASDELVVDKGTDNILLKGTAIMSRWRGQLTGNDDLVIDGGNIKISNARIMSGWKGELQDCDDLAVDKGCIKVKASAVHDAPHAVAEFTGKTEIPKTTPTTFQLTGSTSLNGWTLTNGVLTCTAAGMYSVTTDWRWDSETGQTFNAIIYPEVKVGTAALPTTPHGVMTQEFGQASYSYGATVSRSGVCQAGDTIVPQISMDGNAEPQTLFLRYVQVTVTHLGFQRTPGP